MAKNLFSEAAAYRKKHPGMTMPEAVKACSGKKKPAKKKAAARPKKKAVGRVRRKKTAGKKTAAKKATAPRKLKIKIKPGKKGGGTFTIGAINQARINDELEHKHGLVIALEKHRAMLKTKGLKAGEKAAIRRDIEKYRKSITAANDHIRALR